MDFAVLGANATLLPLLRCIAASEHECSATLELGPWASQIEALTPEAVRDPAWELLLGPPPIYLQQQTVDGLIYRPKIEAVIVAVDPDQDETARLRLADQLRKLAMAGMPLLLVVPCCEGILGYELDMIRRDTKVVLFPYSPLVLHQGAGRVRELMASSTDSSSPSPVGTVEQLVLERATPANDPARRIQQLAADAHLLDGLIGGIVEVSASSSDPEALENLAAHFQGGDTVARWSLVRGTVGQLRLSVIGEHGRVVWTVDDDPHGNPQRFGEGTWQCEVPGAPTASESLDGSGAQAALRAFVEQCRNPEQPQFPTWEGACRAFEVADHAPRSARRGRAVAVQEQTPTEEDTFKGMMAAGSCGLLMLVLFVIVLVGVFESIRFPSQRSKFLQSREDSQGAIEKGLSSPNSVDARNANNRSSEPGRPLWLRVWPVYPLAFFLMLQLFRLVFWERPEQPQASRKKVDNPS